ncbi:hypothetical protein Vi05172_g7058 [Venturia inaequalis]|nr:hypothetical protein Vi05172_g7058 [Venturia inaequalis]
MELIIVEVIIDTILPNKTTIILPNETLIIRRRRRRY